MGLLTDLGLGAARSVRERLGARGALRVLQPMIASSAPSPARAAAIVIALECAAETGDEGAFEALCAWWATEHERAEREQVAAICSAVSPRRPGAALALADAEVQRRDDAASRALRAAVYEARGEVDRAIADWGAAEAAAERDHDQAGARAARIERARAIARRPGGGPEAARLVESFDEAALDDARARLLVASARLGSSGRYARVRGLDALVDLASSDAPGVARAAIRAACAHADRAGAALTEVELERVRSAASRWPDAVERAELLAALDALRATFEGDDAQRSAALVRWASTREASALGRARGVLSGGAAGPRPPGDASEWCALAAIAALRAGRDEDARALLRELRSAGFARRETEGVAAAWTAAWLGMTRGGVRDDALALAEALLATRGAPPRGFCHFAAKLESAGGWRLAIRALARAHEQREPGAREAQVAALTRAGWNAWREGRDEEAREWLVEARALAKGLQSGPGRSRPT